MDEQARQGGSGRGRGNRGFALRSEFHPTPARFDGCFTSIYTMALDVSQGGELVDYLQPEWANIRFFAGSTPTAAIGTMAVRGARFVATGPSTLPCRFALGASRMWGVGFMPLGWARFFTANANSLANVICDGAAHPAFAKFNHLSAVLSEPAASPEEQLAAIIAALDELMRPSRDEAKIARVHQAIVEGTHHSVHDLADACAMSVRTLERVCMRYFGFAPKLLMRRQRFMRSLAKFMTSDAAHWTEAMDPHYHDQAQFTREFHDFMTMNPSEYAALPRPILSSFMEARARVWGSAAQTLDPPRRQP